MHVQADVRRRASAQQRRSPLAPCRGFLQEHPWMVLLLHARSHHISQFVTFPRRSLCRSSRQCRGSMGSSLLVVLGERWNSALLVPSACPVCGRQERVGELTDLTLTREQARAGGRPPSVSTTFPAFLCLAQNPPGCCHLQGLALSFPTTSVAASNLRPKQSANFQPASLQMAAPSAKSSS